MVSLLTASCAATVPPVAEFPSAAALSAIEARPAPTPRILVVFIDHA
jgi:hypothetical protein